jgi:hypothetical protein
MAEQQIELAETGEVLTLDSDGGLSDAQDSTFEDCGGGIWLRMTGDQVQLLALEGDSASVLARW